MYEDRAKHKVTAGSLSQYIVYPDHLDPLLVKAQAAVCAKVLIASQKFMPAWASGAWNPQIPKICYRELLCQERLLETA